MRISNDIDKVFRFGRINTIIYINLHMKMFHIGLAVILYSSCACRLISNRLGIVIHMSGITLPIFLGNERRVFLTHLFNGRNVTSSINATILWFPNISCIRSSVISCNWEVTGYVLSVKSRYGFYSIIIRMIITSTIIRIPIPFTTITEIPSIVIPSKLYVSNSINISISF